MKRNSVIFLSLFFCTSFGYAAGRRAINAALKQAARTSTAKTRIQKKGSPVLKIDPFACQFIPHRQAVVRYPVAQITPDNPRIPNFDQLKRLKRSNFAGFHITAFYKAENTIYSAHEAAKTISQLKKTDAEEIHIELDEFEEWDDFDNFPLDDID